MDEEEEASGDTAYEQKIREMNKAIKAQIRTTDPNEEDAEEPARFE